MYHKQLICQQILAWVFITLMVLSTADIPDGNSACASDSGRYRCVYGNHDGLGGHRGYGAHSDYGGQLGSGRVKTFQLIHEKTLINYGSQPGYEILRGREELNEHGTEVQRIMLIHEHRGTNSGYHGRNGGHGGGGVMPIIKTMHENTYSNEISSSYFDKNTHKGHSQSYGLNDGGLVGVDNVKTIKIRHDLAIAGYGAFQELQSRTYGGAAVSVGKKVHAHGSSTYGSGAVGVMNEQRAFSGADAIGGGYRYGIGLESANIIEKKDNYVVRKEFDNGSGIQGSNDFKTIKVTHNRDSRSNTRELGSKDHDVTVKDINELDDGTSSGSGHYLYRCS